jgi:energy-converting hydrogenase Eha subunit C
VEDGKSEKAFGIYLSCSSAGFFVASLLSGPIVVRSMDLSALYTIIPYAIAAALILFIRDVKYVSQEKIGLKQSIKSILSNKNVLLIVGSSALAGEVSHSIGVFLNQPQYIKSGISVGYFGVLTAFMQGVCMLSAKTHKLTKRFGQANTVKTLLLGMLISCIVLIFTKNPWLTIITVALIQGGFAVIQPTVLDIENKAILLQNRATILSMYAMSGDIIASIVNISVGRAADISVETAFAVCGIVAFIAGILSWIYFVRARTVQSDKK